LRFIAQDFASFCFGSSNEIQIGSIVFGTGISGVGVFEADIIFF